MKVRTVLFLGLVILVGCRPKYEATPKAVTASDFENVQGWIPCKESNLFTIQKDDAYSGKYSMRVKDGQGFSFIFKGKLKDFCDKKVNWISYTAMYKKISGRVRGTSVVCEVTDSLNKRLAWIDSELHFKLIVKDQWTEIKSRFDISKINNPSNNIALFVWNKETGDEIIIDDVVVKFF